MRSREEVVAKARELAEAGRVDDAKALLDAWKARQGGSTGSGENSSPGASQAPSGAYTGGTQASPDVPVGFDPQSYWDFLKQVRRGMSLGFWKDDEGAERLRESGLGAAETVGNIAGGAITGGGVGGAAVKGVKGLLGLGAAEGGLTGAGYSEAETPMGVAGDVAKGAALGVGIPAVPVAGAAGYKWARRALSPNADVGAAKYLDDVVQQSGVTPEELVHDARMLGPEGTVADTTPLAMATARRAAANADLPTQNEVVRRAEYRQAGQEGRIGEAANEALGETSEAAAIAGEAAKRSQDGGPLYQQAFREKPRWGPEEMATYNAIAERPSIQKAKKSAEKLAAEQDRSLDDMSTIEYLHFLKQGLDDRISVLAGKTKPGTGDLNEVRALMGTKGQLIKLLDSSDSYKEARRIYSDSWAKQNAFETGKNVFKGTFDKETVEQVTKGMSDIEREYFRSGFREAITNQSAVGPLTKKQQAVMRHLFGEDTDVDVLNRQLRTEGVYTQSDRSLSNIGVPDPELPMVGRIFGGLGLGNVGLVAGGAAEQATRVASRMNQPTANRIALLLTDPRTTPEDIAKLIRHRRLTPGSPGFYRNTSGLAAGATNAAGILEEK